MNALEKLRTILDYYNLTRQVGHTTGMLEGANYTDGALILTHNMVMAEELKKNLGSPSSVTLQSIHSDSMLRGMKKPLFVDNAAWQVLLSEAFNEIAQINNENTRLKKAIADLIA